MIPVFIVLIAQDGYGERYSSLYVDAFTTREAALLHIVSDDDLESDPNVFILEASPL